MKRSQFIETHMSFITDQCIIEIILGLVIISLLVALQFQNELKFNNDCRLIRLDNGKQEFKCMNQYQYIQVNLRFIIYLIIQNYMSQVIGIINIQLIKNKIFYNLIQTCFLLIFGLCQVYQNQLNQTYFYMFWYKMLVVFLFVLIYKYISKHNMIFQIYKLSFFVVFIIVFIIRV